MVGTEARKLWSRAAATQKKQRVETHNKAGDEEKGSSLFRFLVKRASSGAGLRSVLGEKAHSKRGLFVSVRLGTTTTTRIRGVGLLGLAFNLGLL